MQQGTSSSAETPTTYVSSQSSTSRSHSERGEEAVEERQDRPKRSRKKSARELRVETRKAKEESRLYNLMLDVNNLKQEIGQLTVLRDLLLQARARHEAASTSDAIRSRLRMYFDGFKHGYRDSDSAQRDFVRSIASDAFTLGMTAYGVDVLLEQWSRYTVVFGITDVDLISIECVVKKTCGCVVYKCAAEFRGVFTRLVVDTVFPNARAHLWQLLQVLGAKVVCPMLFHVYFDRSGSLLRQDLVTDFLAVMTNLLGGDMQLACCFLQGSRVGDESMIDRPQYRR